MLVRTVLSSSYYLYHYLYYNQLFTENYAGVYELRTRN